MVRRSSFSAPQTIDVRGVWGTFRVPSAELNVEYVLTYASLDASQAAHGQLFNLLVPVREAFDVKTLNFDQLLQRDLDDYRVAHEMMPYLLGDVSPDPRFFPPIVAVIVPWIDGVMREKYPKSTSITKDQNGFKLNTQKFGQVFSIAREQNEDGELARSPVDLSIHEANAKLVIIDGQHRAMAMLAAYRSAYSKWGKSQLGQFKYFYESISNIKAADKSYAFNSIHLPVCIVYFPELMEQSQAVPKGLDLTKACRKLFLDVNSNARRPSEARQILMNDTNLAAFYTRDIFNTFKLSAKAGTVRLHHTEYDNPYDRVPITRPFALTDVYAIYQIISSVLLLDNTRVRDARASGTRTFSNNVRMQRELELGDVFTEEDFANYEFGLKDIQLNDYPRQIEPQLRKCFEDGWGKVIADVFSNLYTFAKHINAVDQILEENKPYIGPASIAESALTEGQGLRFALQTQQERDKKQRRKEGIQEPTDAEKGWGALLKLENEFEERRAKLYLNLRKSPDEEQLKLVTRLYTAYRNTAFQLGLFMAFAYLKDRLELSNERFKEQAPKWVERLNKHFKTSEGVRTVLYNFNDPTSLRNIYKPTGGVTVADWTFFRYTILELLSPGSGKERAVLKEARVGWRNLLFSKLYARKEREIGSEEESGVDLKELTLRDITNAYKHSLNIDKDVIRKDLADSLGSPDKSYSLHMIESDDSEIVEEEAV